MWNISKEAQLQVDNLKKNYKEQFDITNANYEKDKWLELIDFFQRRSTTFTEKLQTSEEEKTVKYYKYSVQNQNQLNYSNNEDELLAREFQIKNVKSCNNVKSKQNAKHCFEQSDDFIKTTEKLQIFADYMNSGKSLTKDQLHEVFEIAVKYDIDIEYIMQNINKFQESEAINELYDIFVSSQPNSSMIKSFLSFIIKPRVNQVLSNEKSRNLGQCLISCFKNFTKEMVDLIVLPFLLNFEAKWKSTLLAIINSATYEGKHCILNAFADHGILTIEQIPILEKLITVHMDNELLGKLIGLIYNFKDIYSNTTSFGVFLVNIIKTINPKLRNNYKETLEEVVRSNASVHKKTLMIIMKLND